MRKDVISLQDSKRRNCTELCGTFVFVYQLFLTIEISKKLTQNIESQAHMYVSVNMHNTRINKTQSLSNSFKLNNSNEWFEIKSVTE